MAAKIFWGQNGGNPVVNDDNGYCPFPSTAMAPRSCAADFGLKPQDWHGTTTGHRGHGTFANTRILDFRNPKDTVYCRPNCLTDKPVCCEEDKDLCPVFPNGEEGWNNQVGWNDYYCQIRDSLEVGDCIATHLVPSQEIFESFTWGTIKKADGIMGKFKLMCADVDLTPTIDFGEFSPHMQTVYIYDEFGNDVANGNRCDGYDVILFEIEAMPDDSPEEDCKPAKGKLDDFVLYGDARMAALCTGK